MALVGQNQQTTFANPQNGQAPDADVIRGNDNATVAKHNAHDADATIHVQTGLLSARPAAGTAYAMYLDENRRLYVDNGSAWSEVPYARLDAAGTNAFTNNVTVGGVLTVNGLTDVLDIDAQDIVADTATIAGAVSAASLSGNGSAITSLNPANIGSGTYNMQDSVLQRPRLQDYGEVRTTPTISGNTLTLNLENGNVFSVTHNANINTLTIQNPSASGTACSFTLALTYTASAFTVTWPAAIRWSGGVAPTLTAGNNKVDLFSFVTFDAGTTWFGTAAQNF